MATHTFWIPRFRPVRLNQLLYRHWQAVRRLKHGDEQLVGHYFRQSGIPPATGKRRVSLVIRLKPRAKQADDDAIWKCLLDGLVRAHALRDDNRAGVEMGSIEYERGKIDDWGTLIILEDLNPTETTT